MDMQKTDLTGQQVEGAARAGIDLLNRGSTLIPGDIKQQLAVLEVILQNIVMGAVIIAPAQKDQVESKPDGDAEVNPELAAAVAVAAVIGDKPIMPEDFPKPQAD